MGRNRKKNRNKAKLTTEAASNDQGQDANSEEVPEIKKAELRDESHRQETIDDDESEGFPEPVLLQGEWDPQELAARGLFRTEPYKMHYDIYRFLFPFAFVFSVIFAGTFVFIFVCGNEFLLGKYGEDMWKPLLAVFILYEMAIASAMLALKQLPPLLTYLLKLIGILSILIGGVFTFGVLAKSELFYLIFQEISWNTVNSICSVWWLVFINFAVTVVILYDRSKLKNELNCFLRFNEVFTGTLIVLLIVLMFLAIFDWNKWIYVHVNESFTRIMFSLYAIQLLACISAKCVRFHQRNDPPLF